MQGEAFVLADELIRDGLEGDALRFASRVSERKGQHRLLHGALIDRIAGMLGLEPHRRGTFWIVEVGAIKSQHEAIRRELLHRASDRRDDDAFFGIRMRDERSRFQPGPALGSASGHAI